MTKSLYAGASTLLVLMLPHLVRFGQPFWAGERPSDALVLALGYVAVLWIVTFAGASTVRRLAAGGAALAVLGGGVLAVAAIAPAVEISRSLTLVSVAVGAGLLVAGELGNSFVRVAVLLAGVIAGVAAAARVTPPPAPSSSAQAIFTTYETLELVNHGRVVDSSDVHIGGGFARLGDRVIVVTGYGALYSLAWDEGRERIVSQRLPVERPVDIPSFEPLITTNPAEAVRVLHVLGRPVEAGWELFVSHHVWDANERCVSVAVSSVTLTEDLGRVLQDWRRVATTQPCLTADRNDLGEGFQGLLSGGRMAWFAPGQLLMTIGEHGWDTIARPLPISQLDEYDYGKTRILDVATGEFLPFTKGHRNPQGLFIDDRGRVWATEHGPRGGDELNLLQRGGNYGWPYATWGTDYSSLTWPGTSHASEHTEFVEPHFAWLPSIGISALIGVRGDSLSRWKSNLLAGSLAGKALQRISLDGERIRYVENIPLGLRVRDLIETPDGAIWIWTDEGEVASLRQAGEEAQSALAFTACTSCHRIAPGEQGGLGPNLFGVVGRAVASEGAFTGYSPSLRNVGGVWTDERLDAFLTDPESFAPGSTMSFRVTDPATRSAVIRFLRTAR